MENNKICVRLPFEKWSPGFKNKSLGLDVKDYDWKEEIVYIYPDTYKSNFTIRIANKDGRTYARPFIPYKKSEFEELFGLGMLCTGYNENITIDITDYI